MGAAWIHGMSDKNPIVQIQKKLKLKTFATDYDSEVVYSYESGEKYSEDKREAMWDAHAKVGGRMSVKKQLITYAHFDKLRQSQFQIEGT